MRLSTLARKVNKTPTQLIVFLNEQGIDITNGLHGKLEKDAVKIVLDKYQPVLPDEATIEKEPEAPTEDTEVTLTEATEIIPEATVEETLEAEEAREPEKAPEIHEAKIEEIPMEAMDKIADQEVPEKPKTGTVEDLENGGLDDIEHIKVKKVKLEGIKVIGKIDLPEKPKKDPEIHEEGVDTQSEDATKPKPIRKGNDRHNRRTGKGRNRKPLTFEEKLKQEERNKLREKQQKARAEKRRKQKYYQENIQPKRNSKPPKRKRKSTVHYSTQKEETIAPHKNPIKRLWAWLNGKYDRY